MNGGPLNNAQKKESIMRTLFLSVKGFTVMGPSAANSKPAAALGSRSAEKRKPAANARPNPPKKPGGFAGLQNVSSHVTQSKAEYPVRN